MQQKCSFISLVMFEVMDIELKAERLDSFRCILNSKPQDVMLQMCTSMISINFRLQFFWSQVYWSLSDVSALTQTIILYLSPLLGLTLWWSLPTQPYWFVTLPSFQILPTVFQICCFCCCFLSLCPFLFFPQHLLSSLVSIWYIKVKKQKGFLAQCQMRSGVSCISAPL